MNYLSLELLADLTALLIHGLSNELHFDHIYAPTPADWTMMGNDGHPIRSLLMTNDCGQILLFLAQRKMTQQITAVPSDKAEIDEAFR